LTNDQAPGMTASWGLLCEVAGYGMVLIVVTCVVS
jgi:hypothetical protein